MMPKINAHSATERPAPAADASPSRLPLELWRDIQSRVDDRTFISTLGLSRGHRALPSVPELEDRVRTPRGGWCPALPNHRDGLVALCVEQAHAAERIAATIRSDNFTSYRDLGNVALFSGASRYGLRDRKLIDIATGAEHTLLPGDQLDAYGLDFSDDGRYFSAQRHSFWEFPDDQACLLIWDVQSGKPEPVRFGEICAAQGVIPNVAPGTQDFWTHDWDTWFSRNVGCDVYVAFMDRAVPRLFKLSGHSAPVRGSIAGGLPGAETIATMSANEVLVWTFDTGVPVAERIEGSFGASRGGFALSRNMLFVGEDEHSAHLGRLWERTQDGWQPHAHPVTATDFTEDFRFYVFEEADGVVLLELSPDKGARALDASLLQPGDGSDDDSDDDAAGWSFELNNHRMLQHSDGVAWIGAEGAEQFQLPGLAVPGCPSDLKIARDGDYAFLVRHGELLGWDMRGPVIKAITVPDLPEGFSGEKLECAQHTVWVRSNDAVWCWPMAFKEAKVLNLPNANYYSDISPEGFLVLGTYGGPGYIVDVRHPDCPMARLPVPPDFFAGSYGFTDDGTRLLVRETLGERVCLIDLLGRD